MRAMDRSQAFARNVIDHVEHPEALPVGELVMDKIQRPAHIGPRLDQDRGPMALRRAFRLRTVNPSSR